MKKVNLSLKKNTAVQSPSNAQKKISAFFVKPQNNEESINKDHGMSKTIVQTNSINDNTQKKRKMTNEPELQITYMKITKFNNTSDVCHAQKIQDHERISSTSNSRVLQEANEHNQSQNMSSNNETWADVDAEFFKDLFLSPKKKSPEKKSSNSKENIDIVKGTMQNSSVGNIERLLNTEVVGKSPSTKNNMKLSEHSVGISIRSKQHVEDIEDFFESDFDLKSMNDVSDCFGDDWNTDTQINFHSLQRCKVIEVERECNSMILTVEHEDLVSTAKVTCSGFWKDAKVVENNIVAIQARKEADSWIVDNSSGFLVVHPDVLISGTTVVSGLFCSRKAVLTERFRKMESLPYFRGDQTAMVIGSLAHQLLQKAIRTNIQELSDITKLMDEILKSRQTTGLLYTSEITYAECKEKMLAYVPRIFEFIQHYIKGKKQHQISNMRNNFKGTIAHVEDIEENIWLPKLGIKGKVDVTVQVNINSNRRIMPLEIKTGKPSFSLEHKGQIILYIMMMALTGQDTDTGLLLYLRDNTMQEIKSGHPERRDLILLRNTLANYFLSKPMEKITDSASESEWQPMDLPEPINHHSACNTCTYKELCCMYLSKDTNTQLSEFHPLTKISKQILDKFSHSHIDYIVKWIWLLQLEESSQMSENVLKYIWTLSPEKREAKRTCISNLKVIGKVLERNSKYQHMFVRVNGNEQIRNTNISNMDFSENEYVVVSTNNRINISSGFIVNIKEDTIAVMLDRDITKYGIDSSFHIDKYSSSSLYSFNLANVGGLMSDDEICTKLRDIVIDRKPATFIKKLSHSIVSRSAAILRDLNENQQRAVLEAMTAVDYILIKGMPGTGKTQTLVALIKLLYKTGYSVLVTAHTNSAVDNILLKLLDENLDFLRLGSMSSIHPLLKHKTEAYATANCHTPESLDAFYSGKSIIGATCYGAHHALLGRRMFDVCVVDECTQAMQPAVLRPLYSARKFVLVGDPDQLPPIVKSKRARKLGADESLFIRLDSDNNTVTLKKQYRMNKIIMHLANKLTYQNQLETGNASIANATFNAKHSEELQKESKWIQSALSQEINKSVIVLNTGRTSDLKIDSDLDKKYSESDQLCSNIYEAAVILRMLRTLIEVGVNMKNIGVIAPYRAQVNLLKKIFPSDVEVNTVDQYQGRDKEIIIYSCTRSLLTEINIKEDLEVLGDHRRLTVAITRAKHKLIVIADKHTLSQYTAFKKLFELIKEENIINLNEGCDDFSWKRIMTLL